MTCKPHPASRTLIEKYTKLWWRIVERETTRNGFSKEFQLIEENLPRYDVARFQFDKLRKHHP